MSTKSFQGAVICAIAVAACILRGAWIGNPQGKFWNEERINYAYLFTVGIFCFLPALIVFTALFGIFSNRKK